MLNVQFGDMSDAVYNTAEYFKNAYLPEWITKPLSVEMIRDVDKSEVVGPNLIESPVLGPISPLQLSGGVKTLMLLDNDRSRVFNISTCGNNCAKWILHIAEQRSKQKRRLLVNLRHLMDFGEGPFKIRVRDPEGHSKGIATNMDEFLLLAGDYV
ncbi:MAG: DUF4869 domain-containing protein [Atopobiaceae bacterium]|nr:DUF4869 domain-containing protein [Atopobiaceae bacterium]